MSWGYKGHILRSCTNSNELIQQLTILTLNERRFHSLLELRLENADDNQPEFGLDYKIMMESEEMNEYIKSPLRNSYVQRILNSGQKMGRIGGIIIWISGKMTNVGGQGRRRPRRRRLAPDKTSVLIGFLIDDRKIAPRPGLVSCEPRDVQARLVEPEYIQRHARRTRLRRWGSG